MDIEMRQTDLLDRIFEVLQKIHPIPEPRLKEVKLAMREEFGGERGVCKRSPADRQAMIREVLQRFNGMNATTLARELGISRATVYRLLKQPGSK